MAERLAGGLLILLLGVFSLALFTPHAPLFHGQPHCHFHGVPHAESQREEAPLQSSRQKASPRPPIPSVPALPIPLPQLLSARTEEISLPPLTAPDVPPLETEEYAPNDLPLTTAEFTLGTTSEPATPPRPKPARTAAAAGEKQKNTLQAPAYLQAPPPPYPPALKRRRVEGSVGLRIHVSAEGAPTAVDVTAPSPHRDFNTHARHWVLRHWKFAPARQGEQCIPGIVNTRIIFTLAASEHP